ncbi:hypothetical protein JXD20_03610 [Candidatus Peregrinibacteria bacterium]|nr:hypothetical protein [Candidatus Peregrinibacteria bacterium]
MTPNTLLIGFSLLALVTLIVTSHFYRKVGFKSILGLFAFGILIATPFILIEHFGINLNLLYVVAAFLFIELGILFFEHHVKYFHDLIHHNIKELRIASFLLIGFGFTYAEIGFAIFESSDMMELLNTIPFKTTYALLMHTVFASAASLVQVGRLVAEGLHTTIMRFATYYIRIGIISVSHFAYVFSVENHLMFLIGALLIVGITAFFYIKRKIDLKPEAIE